MRRAKPSDTYRYEPDYAVAPGAVLAEILGELEMSHAEFARRCGRSAKLISEIIAGKAPVEPETALQFERVLGMEASVWLNLEANQQLHAAKRVVAPGDDSEDRRLHASVMAELPVPLASRIVRGLLRELGVLPEAAHVEAVIGLAAARRGARTILPGGLIAIRDREYVRLSRPSPAGSPPARPRR